MLSTTTWVRGMVENSRGKETSYLWIVKTLLTYSLLWWLTYLMDQTCAESCRSIAGHLHHIQACSLVAESMPVIVAKYFQIPPK